MKPRPVAFLLPLFWMAFIYILLTMPNRDIPQVGFLDVIYFDKWVHAGIFAVLTFLFSWPFRKLYPVQHGLFISIAFLALLYGIAMEFVQKYFTTDRDFDVYDMLADGFGCLIGYIAFRFVMNKLKNTAKNKPL